jgi:hypothetical protein
MFSVRILFLHQPRKSKSLQSKAGADVNRGIENIKEKK